MSKANKSFTREISMEELEEYFDLKIPQEKLDEFKSQFEEIDRDGSGDLDYSEIQDYFKRKNLGKGDDNYFLKIMESLEITKDSSIGYKEFIDVLTKAYQNDKIIEETTKAFEYFDQQKRKRIPKDKLKRICTQMGNQLLTPEDFDRIIKDAGFEGQKEIDYIAFINKWTF